MDNFALAATAFESDGEDDIVMMPDSDINELENNILRQLQEQPLTNNEATEDA